MVSTNNSYVVAFAVAISSSLIMSCSKVTPEQPSAVQSAEEQSTLTKAAEMRPQFGEWGVDLTGMDKTVKPGDDFYSYVNGNWHAQAEIPIDKKDTGPVTLLQDIAYDQLKKMVEDIATDKNAAAGSDRQKIRD